MFLLFRCLLFRCLLFRSPLNHNCMLVFKARCTWFFSALHRRYAGCQIRQRPTISLLPPRCHRAVDERYRPATSHLQTDSTLIRQTLEDFAAGLPNFFVCLSRFLIWLAGFWRGQRVKMGAGTSEFQLDGTPVWWANFWQLFVPILWTVLGLLWQPPV